MDDVLFESERLYYRMPVIDDAKAMQKIKEANWAELQRWMNWSSDGQYDMDATTVFIRDIVAQDHRKGGCLMFAFHKQTHDLVMIGGLNATNEKDVYSTGYWGNVDYLGQGYATEKTMATLQYAFNVLGAKRVDIVYYDGNEASRRVIEKCGFEFVKTLPKNHKCHADGQLMDEHCYAMTRDQWMEKNILKT